jgi:hypothetical protein
MDFLKTGTVGELDTTKLVKDATDIFQPVVESAMVLAAHYATACGRDIVLSEDVRYGLMFAARNVTGRHVGSLYPECYSESGTDSSSADLNSDEDQSGSDEDADFDPDAPEGDDSDQSSWETVDDDELVWTRYEGTDDQQALAMNACADTWDEWVPSNPAEQAIKNAVENVGTR